MEDGSEACSHAVAFLVIFANQYLFFQNNLELISNGNTIKQRIIDLSHH
jgi:hypothetical protein